MRCDAGKARNQTKRCNCNRGDECAHGPAQQRFDGWCLACVMLMNPNDERLPARTAPVHAKEIARGVCLRAAFDGQLSINQSDYLGSYYLDFVGVPVGILADRPLILWQEEEEGEHGHGERVQCVPRDRHPRPHTTHRLLHGAAGLLHRHKNAVHIVRVDDNPDGYQPAQGGRLGTGIDRWVCPIDHPLTSCACLSLHSIHLQQLEI